MQQVIEFMKTGSQVQTYTQNTHPYTHDGAELPDYCVVQDMDEEVAASAWTGFS